MATIFLAENLLNWENLRSDPLQPKQQCVPSAAHPLTSTLKSSIAINSTESPMEEPLPLLGFQTLQGAFRGISRLLSVPVGLFFSSEKKAMTFTSMRDPRAGMGPSSPRSTRSPPAWGVSSPKLLCSALVCLVFKML